MSNIFGPVTSLGGAFARHSTPPNIEKLATRVPVRLSFDMRHSFAVHSSATDPQIGITGWSFAQDGLHYTCHFMDDDGNDDYGYTVTVPSDRQFLHRSREMLWTEKIHALSVVNYLTDKDLKNQIGRHLVRLEDACFEPKSGRVITGPKSTQTLLRDGGLITYLGLRFPIDAAYRHPPQPVVQAFEWLEGYNRYRIDCSRLYIQFLVFAGENSHMKPWAMSPDDARVSAEKVRDCCGHETDGIAKATHLWPRMKFAAKKWPKKADLSP